jgi:hypothetical protein
MTRLMERSRIVLQSILDEMFLLDALDERVILHAMVGVMRCPTLLNASSNPRISQLIQRNLSQQMVWRWLIMDR